MTHSNTMSEIIFQYSIRRTIMYNQLSTPKFKFYLKLVLFFVLPQFLCGIIFSNHFRFNSRDIFLLYVFLRNLFLLTFFIYDFKLVLNNAKKVNKTFYKKTQKMLFVYFISSLIITSFIYRRPYTLFSYLGNCWPYNLFCESICQTFKILITGQPFP